MNVINLPITREDHATGKVKIFGHVQFLLEDKKIVSRVACLYEGATSKECSVEELLERTEKDLGGTCVFTKPDLEVEEGR